MEEATKSKKYIYSYLTNEWHNPLKDQVVLHAIHIILNKPFEPKIKGVSPFYISSITSNLLREKGVIINPTYDIGSCSIMIHKLVCSLCHDNASFLSAIESESEKLWIEFYQDLLPNMP